MKFKIERTSGPWWGDANFKKYPPCDDVILCSTSIPVYSNIPDENGKIIRFENGRTRTKYWWEIEIDTLEGLLEFQKKLGCELIVYEDTIEIYDSYRE